LLNLNISKFIGSDIGGGGAENAGPENAGLKLHDWKMQDLENAACNENNEFHIYACVTDTSSRPHCMWVSG